MQNLFMAGQLVYLRPLEPTDASLVAACNNDPVVRISFFTHTPTSLARTTDQIRTYYDKGSDYIPLAICPHELDQAVGVTAFHRVDLVSRAAVFSICMPDPLARGKGFGKDATRLMLQYGFDVLNLHRIQLHVWADNKAAHHIYESCGFRQEGLLREAMMHNGKYCDFLVMSILESEWRAAK